MSARQKAIHVLQDVFDSHKTLEQAFATNRVEDAFVKALCFGVCRWYPWLENITLQLLKKPLKAKDDDIELLLFMGLYELHFMRTPDHAVVNETVDCVLALKKPWAKGLVNAVLRHFLRHKQACLDRLSADETAQYAHPAEWLTRLKADYPHDWAAIATANNQQAPMTLRVNQRQTSRADYLLQLKAVGLAATACRYSSVGVRLQEPVDVYLLPGFSDGVVSVQDESAQLAASLLDIKPGMRLLDACAAPGGKTAQILEACPQADVLALDKQAHRLAKVEETLSRLNLSAKTQCADALSVEQWWDKAYFDRILLDAPCSASGVIRRHPEIKFLRTQEDIRALATQQLALCEALWLTLKPGGLFLYVTCSILPEENQAVLRTFLKKVDDAQSVSLPVPWGREQSIGRQILPGEENADGFYYALLKKA